MTCLLIAALIALGVKPDCNGGWAATACTCDGGLMDN